MASSISCKDFTLLNCRSTASVSMAGQTKKRLELLPGAIVSSASPNFNGLVNHSAHAATVAVTARSRRFILLRHFGDQAFGGQEQPRDAGCVLQRAARDFLGIHHAGFDEVF